MKTIVSILVGLAVFVLCFMGMGTLINWITGGIQSPDVKGIMRVVAWIFCGGVTLMFAIGLGVFAGKIISIIWPEKRRRY